MSGNKDIVMILEMDDCLFLEGIQFKWKLQQQPQDGRNYMDKVHNLWNHKQTNLLKYHRITKRQVNSKLLHGEKTWKTLAINRIWQMFQPMACF